MKETTEIKWDSYGNPIVCPDGEDETSTIEEKSLVTNLLEKLKNRLGI